MPPLPRGGCVTHLPPRIPFFGFGGRGANPCVRFLGDIAILITHWDKFAERTTPCRDNCAGCEQGHEQQLTGYAPAQQLNPRGTNWETIVYDVAQGWLADFQSGLRGRTYAVRRQGGCGRRHEYLNSTQPASAAFDIVQWARRYWRIPANESIKSVPFDECIATLETIRLSEPADILPFRQTNPLTSSPSVDRSPEEWQRVREILDKNRERMAGRKAGA